MSPLTNLYLFSFELELDPRQHETRHLTESAFRTLINKVLEIALPKCDIQQTVQ